MKFPVFSYPRAKSVVVCGDVHGDFLKLVYDMDTNAAREYLKQIKGVGNNRFAPLETATKEQAILIALRIYNSYNEW